MFYAQINVSGICYAVSQLAGVVDHPSMIPLATMDETILGQQWTGAGWRDASPAP